MSSTTSSTTVAPVRRRNLIDSLFPSVVSGIVLGVVGAVIAGLLVNKITTAVSPKSVPNDDAVTVAVYAFWVLFFMIGVGAFNGIIKWAFYRHEATVAEDLHLAGKDQGLWRYFRFTTDHKVVGMQYLATVLVLFFVGSMGAFSIRRKRDRKSTRLNSSHTVISYAVFCLKKKKKKKKNNRSIDKKTKQMSHA